MSCDRHALRRRLRQLSLQKGEGDEKKLGKLARDIDASVQRCDERSRRRPMIQFDGSLPIHDRREEIAEAIQQRQVVVVAGETGSGKSTQLPKIAMSVGYGIKGMIGHTQPRRIAARSIASRVADELKVPLGEQVGFKIRFTDKTNPQTFIKLMTDGILLAETQGDRFLDQYDLIILDEAHERSINIDFLIGYLRGLLSKRPELRLIITSATIDAERFSEHFADQTGNAPIIAVSGRTYPVDVHYRPLVDAEGEECDAIDGIVAAAHELAEIDRGHMLVFLPTERDIREAARRLRAETFAGDGSRTTEVLPLYARLSAAEQNRIFQPSEYRRIVLSTNVAESSLTVPDVRYVIDTGTARISRYSPRSKVQRLPIEAVSQASANQRMGRCGRVGPGICIRLFDEEEFQRRDEYTTPEIRRTNLAAVILQAKTLRLGEIEEIPFLDPPRPETIRDGYKTLFEIGAVDAHRRLTPIGRQLARMPVDPRIGRMILAAQSEGCLGEVLIIAAALEIQDPRERPYDKQQQADQRHEQFLDTDSDFLSYLKIWDFYHHLRETVSRSQLRKACRQNFLSYNRMREWTEIHRQLLDLVGRRHVRRNSQGPDYAALHRSLLAGLLSGVAYKTNEREYSGAGGLQLVLWPGSGLVRSRKQWVVSAELIETSRRYARTVARISPTWIESLAEHLLKRSYSDPHWHRKSNSVMAYEKVSMFGMPVVTKRRVRYGKINMAESRRIFIEAGLVDQQAQIRDKFFRHNEQIRAEITGLAAKTRRREYVLDDYSFFAFYDQRLPDHVYDVASLRRWLKSPEGDEASLRMRVEDFVDLQGSADHADSFPSQMEIGAMTLPVKYNFQADADDDGVTLVVPSKAVGQLLDHRMGWLVPGLLEEKVVALIRSLPKSLRRNFVPVPDTAREIAAEIDFGQGDLLATLAGHLRQRSGERVAPSDFDLTKLPRHLNINIRVVDDVGEVQHSGRDLEQLRQTLRSNTDDDASSLAHEEWTREGITEWDFGDFPKDVPLEQHGITINAYPALIDAGDSVALRLLDSPVQAAHDTRQGLIRLYTIANRKSLRVQVRHLPRWDECCLWSASLLDADTLKNHLQDRITDLAFVHRRPVPRSEEQFAASVENAVERIAVATQELTPLVPAMFEAYHKARLAFEQATSTRWSDMRNDISIQMAELFADDFLRHVPWMWIQQFPRYLNAIVYRLDKLAGGGEARDREGQDQITPHWDRFTAQQAKNREVGRFDPELEEYRWMVEELRVSLFAQPLGTAIKISPQRLDKQWGKVDTR